MTRTEFILWYHEVFQASDMYARMCETVEDSPYHRERNVGVHTDMVVSQFLSRAPNLEWAPHILRGAFACAFHDVGKPSSEEVKFREDRGEYRAYSGHEIVSARYWEDHVVSNWKFFDETFGLKAFDIYAVAWMIEHHLPYATKKADKLAALYQTAAMVGDGTDVFLDVLLADTYGRISDDAEAKRQATEEYAEWFRVGMFDHDCDPYERVPWSEFEKVVILPIGASGSGKSTWFGDFQAGRPDALSYSWDALRLEWYDIEDYTRAYELQCEDRDFGKKANARFVEDLGRSDTVIVDNTNLTKKRRAFFVNTARQKGFKVVGVTFPISVQELKDRQRIRSDKHVPVGAVLGHYHSLQQPFYGEFDDVVVCGHNLRSV